MDEIKPKWKAFAASYMLSAWDERTASQVFDLIVHCEEKDLQAMMDDHDILAWSPFHEEEPANLARLMWQLAADAQATEALN